MKPKKVILCPNFVVSRNDGERHFIGAWRLAQLYHVLPTDSVKTYDGRHHFMPLDQQQREGWIELWPRNDGKYYDIHEFDEGLVLPLTPHKRYDNR